MPAEGWRKGWIMGSVMTSKWVWIGFLAAGVLMPLSGWAAEDHGRGGTWAVKEAPVRFILGLENSPSHPEAGYFVTIPDGGALPGPFPDPAVFDAAGNPLKSAVLWQNRNTGFSLVFEAPKQGGEAVVYVSGVDKLRLWTPDSGLKPSAILCVRPGAGGRTDAIQLQNFGPIGPMAHYLNVGQFSTYWRGERLGLVMGEGASSSGLRKGPFCLYTLAHLVVTDPGITWVAPVTLAGQVEVAIDGQMLSTFRKNEKRGGLGASINLTAGVHRLECFGYNPAGGGTGPMMLMWRTPKTAPEEMGGKRTPEMKYPGTPMFEARHLRPDEVLRSGRCRVSDVQSREGGAVACFTVSFDRVFAFGGEEPLILCSLKALAAKNPPETSYEWTFGEAPGAVAKGAEIAWLFKGGIDHWVKLTAEAGGKRSESTYPFLPFVTTGSSLDDDSTRAGFYRACLSMLKAYPEKADPFASWDAGLWNSFFRVLDIETTNPLLDYLVTARWDSFRKKVDAGKRSWVEDLFLLGMASRDPKEALKWAAEFCRNDIPRARYVELQAKMAEIMMFYLNDLDGARKVIRPLLLDSGENGDLARIRAGDVEFLARNLNEATRIYGEVQNRSKHAGQVAGAGEGERQEGDSGKPAAQAGGTARKAAKAAARAAHKQELSKAQEPPKPQEPPPAVAAWKLAAIRDVAASEGVSSMVGQRHYQEAWMALRKWEREFPLAKVTGDYCLQEAKFYIAIGDYRRARAILTAYCDQVDASNFVPEALKRIVSCMISMGEPEEAVQKYQKEIDKRMRVGTADDKEGGSL